MMKNTKIARMTQKMMEILNKDVLKKTNTLASRIIALMN